MSGLAIERRSEVCLADLINAAASLGATDPRALVRIATALGLDQATQESVSDEVEERADPTSPASVLEVADVDPLPMEPPDASSVDDVRWVADEDDLCAERVEARLVEIGADGPPDWLGSVAPLREPSGRRPSVIPAPPIPVLQTRAVLALAAAQPGPTRLLDLPGLLRRITEGLPFDRIPMLAQPRIASPLQLLLDRGRGMEPYTGDLAYIVEHLRAVAGLDRVEVGSFVGSPLRGLDGSRPGKIDRWSLPQPSTLILVVTDLGIGGPAWNPDRAHPEEWQEFASAVAKAEVRLRILTPMPARRWPRGLAELARIVSWPELTAPSVLDG